MSTAMLPRWQLSSIFPSLESGLYQGAQVDLEVGISRLEADWPLPASGAVSGPLDDARVSAVESALTELNRLLTIHSDLLAFLTGLTSTDAFDDKAQAELSGLQPLVSRLKVLGTHLTATIGGIDTAELMLRSAVAASHRFRLERAKVEANHLMTPEAEELAASLNISSGRAWSTLHGDLISRTTIERHLPGNEGPERYTLSQLQNLQYEPSRELRRAAYLAELDLLERNAVSFAAALNGIKGQVDTLNRSRSWGSPLDQALHQAGITREALNALRSAAQENFPVFRRYLRVKAKLLGLDALAWYDFLAPIGRVRQEVQLGPGQSAGVGAVSGVRRGVGTIFKAGLRAGLDRRPAPARQAETEPSAWRCRGDLNLGSCSISVGASTTCLSSLTSSATDTTTGA